jgi:hypothetical protein
VPSADFIVTHKSGIVDDVSKQHYTQPAMWSDLIYIRHSDNSSAELRYEHRPTAT